MTAPARKRVRDKKPIGKVRLRAYAYGLLARRDYCRQQLFGKLTGKVRRAHAASGSSRIDSHGDNHNVDGETGPRIGPRIGSVTEQPDEAGLIDAEDLVNVVLDDLGDLIDDKLYALRRSRFLLRKGYPLSVIAGKLDVDGITPAIAADVAAALKSALLPLADLWPYERRADLIDWYALHRRCRHLGPPADPDKFHRRLLARGFDAELVFGHARHLTGDRADAGMIRSIEAVLDGLG